MRPFDSTSLPKARQGDEFVLPSLPLDLEIGCGTGMFALNYAKAHPNRYLVAIEHTREKFKKFSDQLEMAGGLPNLLAVHANAISWVTHQLGPGEVDKIFLLYPNPNPKAKHQNKRWHAMPFMGKLIEVLKPGGELLLATNEAFYFEEAQEFFTQTWGLEEQEVLSFDQSHSLAKVPRTLFEKKYLERGETCYQLLLAKPEA